MSMTAQAPNGTRWWLLLPDNPTLPMVSTSHPPTIADSYWDAPCLFSTDRATAWQFEVSNGGQFFTVPAPLARAAYEYVEFVGRDGISRLLRVDNLGQMVTT